MWQRIQTLYLAVATLLTAALFWCSLSNVIEPDGTVTMIKYTDKPIFTVWLTILTVLQVLALGGYKWRMKQIRVVIFTAIVQLGFLGWLVFYFFQTRGMEVLSWTALLPMVAAVMDFLAAKNILLDEAIVYSANRLRSPRKKKK